MPSPDTIKRVALNAAKRAAGFRMLQRFVHNDDYADVAKMVDDYTRLASRIREQREAEK